MTLWDRYSGWDDAFNGMDSPEMDVHGIFSTTVENIPVPTYIRRKHTRCFLLRRDEWTNEQTNEHIFFIVKINKRLLKSYKT